jgi:hypothetical protein
METKIRTLPKPGRDPTFLQNLRSISLLSTTCKLFEKLILRTLQKHIRERNLLNESQFGFLGDCSMKLQCTRLADHITLNFNNNMSMAAVFLDIEKALNKTWHSGILYKLSELACSTSLIKLIASFLTSRKFKVLVEGEFSTPRNIAAGVPQGSVLVLASILYSLYKRCPCGTWHSSCPVRGRYLYLRDRETWPSCSLQVPTRPQCSETLVWVMEHKD